MKIRQIMALTGATVVCGNGREDHEVQCAFASDLMSDVLTLDCNGVLLVHGSVQHADDPDGRDGGCFLHPVRQGKESDSRYFTTGGRKRDDPDGNGPLDVPYSR